MGVVTDILTPLETVLTAQGIKVGKEIFNFDAVPDSTVDNTYRYEFVGEDGAEISGNNQLERIAIDLYIAYKPPRGILTQKIQKEKITISETLRIAIYAAICKGIKGGVEFAEMFSPGASRYYVMRIPLVIDEYQWSVST